MNKRQSADGKARGSGLAVALLRVSSDKQFQHGQSIETQQMKVDLCADRRQMAIVRYFVEHFSGRRTDRLVIEELLGFLGQNSDIKAVIIGDIDRFTRAGAEMYLFLRRQFYGLGVELIDSTGVIQPSSNTLAHLGFEYDWSVRSPSQMAEVILAENASSEVTNILTRTIGQAIQLAQQGFQVRAPNFGFRNERHTDENGKKRTIMVADKTEASFISAMFQMRAEGILSDTEICERINAMGFKTRPLNRRDLKTRRIVAEIGGKPLDVNRLQKYVARTIYCGVRCEKWTNNEPVRAEVEPIVSIETFNRANKGKIRVVEHADGRLLIDRGDRLHQNHRNNPDFLFRHVVVCPECGKPFLGSKSRGKSGNHFGYYHCSRRHKYLGVNKTEFEATVGYALDFIKAKPGFLGLFREVVREVWIEKNGNAAKERQAVQQHAEELKARQGLLLRKLEQCQSAIVQEKLEAEIEGLEAQIKSAGRQRQAHALKSDEINAYFEIAKYLLEHPRRFAFKAETKGELEKIWSFIFVSLPSYRDLRDGTPDLRLVYRLSRQSKADKIQLASQLSAQWNTFERDVRAALDEDWSCLAKNDHPSGCAVNLTIGQTDTGRTVVPEPVPSQNGKPQFSTATLPAVDHRYFPSAAA